MPTRLRKKSRPTKQMNFTSAFKNIKYHRYFRCLAIPTRFLQIKIIYSKNRKKKSVNIGDISPIYRFFTDISDTKMQAYEKIKKNTQNGHFVCFFRNFSKKKNNI